MVEEAHSGKNEYRKFFKSRKDRIIDGICGGLADYTGVDVTLIRILWLLSILINGLGLVAYFLAMILVPVNPAHKNLKEKRKIKRDPTRFWGAVLIVLGLFFLYLRLDLSTYCYFPIPYFWWLKFPWRKLWPLGLIVLGVVYIIFILRREKTKSER